MRVEVGDSGDVSDCNVSLTLPPSPGAAPDALMRRRRWPRLRGAGHVESGVNSIPGWKLEKVGDFINLPLNGERTTVAGTQLFTGQVEAQIPRGQPDLLSRLVSGGGGMSGICEELIPPHCVL